MEHLDYLNNFSKNKIVFDGTVGFSSPTSKELSDTFLFALDTENTNVNDERCITYATQLMYFGTKGKHGKKFIKHEDRFMNLFTHPSDFWKYVNDMPEQNLEFYVFNAEYDVNNLLNFAIRDFNLKEQTLLYSEVEGYEGLYKDETQRLSKNETYTYKKMNRNGKIYRCEIQLGDTVVGKKRVTKKITIIDMAKKLTGRLVSNVESFTSLKMNKSDLDYSIFRDYRHTDYTEEELLYMWNDVYCLCDLVMEYVYSGKYQHTDKLTTSSMALENYKDILLEEFTNALSDPSNILYALGQEYITYCKKNKINFLLARAEEPKYSKKAEKYYSYTNMYTDGEVRFIKEEYINKKDVFNFIFPQLDFTSFDYVKTSYAGGITRFKNKNDVGKWLVGKGIGVDINSSFPYSYTTFKLPFGHGIFHNGDELELSDNRLQIIRVKALNFKIKKNKEPNISKGMLISRAKKSTMETWVKEFHGDCVITMTSEDYRYFIKNYTIEELEVLDYIEYRCMHGLFSAFTNKFYGLKQTLEDSDPVRSWVKLILNAVYGKFGQNKCSEMRADNYNNDTNSIEDTIVQDNENNVELLSDGVYVPLASFVTSYSRLHLIEVLNIINATKGIEWKYCDTDSAYVQGDVNILKKAIKDYIDLDYTGELGKWKIEKYFDKIYIIGIKKYIYYGGKFENDNYSYHATLSGINNKYFKFIEKYCEQDENCICELNNKEDKDFIHEVHEHDRKYYVGEDNNPFIYKDEQLKQRVKGAYRSIRKKTVIDGQILFNTIYCIKGDVK